MINLAVNGGDAMPDGGPLEIAVGSTIDVDHRRARGRADGDGRRPGHGRRHQRPDLRPLLHDQGRRAAPASAWPPWSGSSASSAAASRCARTPARARRSRCTCPKPPDRRYGSGMPDFVFYGDTERSPAMRHELPVTIGDAFLLAIVDGRLHLSVSSLESGRVAAVDAGRRAARLLRPGLPGAPRAGALDARGRPRAGVARRGGDGPPRGDRRPGHAGRDRRPPARRRAHAAPRLRGRGRPAAGEVARGTFRGSAAHRPRPRPAWPPRPPCSARPSATATG